MEVGGEWCFFQKSTLPFTPTIYHAIGTLVGVQLQKLQLENTVSVCGESLTSAGVCLSFVENGKESLAKCCSTLCQSLAALVILPVFSFRLARPLPALQESGTASQASTMPSGIVEEKCRSIVGEVEVLVLTVQVLFPALSRCHAWLPFSAVFRATVTLVLSAAPQQVTSSEWAVKQRLECERCRSPALAMTVLSASPSFTHSVGSSLDTLVVLSSLGLPTHGDVQVPVLYRSTAKSFSLVHLHPCRRHVAIPHHSKATIHSLSLSDYHTSRMNLPSAMAGLWSTMASTSRTVVHISLIARTGVHDSNHFGSEDPSAAT